MIGLGAVFGFRLWFFYMCMILLGSKLGFLQVWQVMFLLEVACL